MIDVIDAWLRLAADRIHDQASALTALDQAIGDGDHGTNMDRGFGAICAMLDAGRPEGDGPQGVAAARLRTSGRTLISTVGGAAGPLYGTALMRAAGLGRRRSRPTRRGRGRGRRARGRDRRDPALGKAMPGEKTMLDALVPAVDAGRAAVADGAAGAEVATAMADAAEAGAHGDHPDARNERASVVPGRAVGRAPGSRAPRQRRCCCARWPTSAAGAKAG